MENNEKTEKTVKNYSTEIALLKDVEAKMKTRYYEDSQRLFKQWDKMLSEPYNEDYGTEFYQIKLNIDRWMFAQEFLKKEISRLINLSWE